LVAELAALSLNSLGLAVDCSIKHENEIEALID
jgi:hypothetical protein